MSDHFANIREIREKLGSSLMEARDFRLRHGDNWKVAMEAEHARLTKKHAVYVSAEEKIRSIIKNHQDRCRGDAILEAIFAVDTLMEIIDVLKADPPTSLQDHVRKDIEKS